ncbi:hypothetical protein KKF84_07910 [Myxococcota bacterium]|nr:hypothetical protein [Myxococcota bacterium]
MDEVIELFTPALLRENLILSGLFTMSYEMMKQTIIGRVKEVFHVDPLWEKALPKDHFDENRKRFVKEVLSLDHDEHEDRACMFWLQKEGVLSDGDLDVAKTLVTKRNRMVHEIEFFYRSEKKDIADSFTQMVKLTDKANRWYLQNEVPEAEDLKGETPTGMAWMIAMACQVALNHDDSFIESWKAFGNAMTSPSQTN